jgi:NusA-like KH domain protein
MRAKLDMKTIQNMNLFERITRVKAKNCFTYNYITVFVVQRYQLSQALGRNAENINILSKKFNRKVRIIADPLGRFDLEKFIKTIIFPYEFKSLVCENHELIIFSMSRTKAALIGRDKARLKELSDILDQFFNIKKVIIK